MENGQQGIDSWFRPGKQKRLRSASPVESEWRRSESLERLPSPTAGSSELEVRTAESTMSSTWSCIRCPYQADIPPDRSREEFVREHDDYHYALQLDGRTTTSSQHGRKKARQAQIGLRAFFSPKT